jgi:5-methylcytosine-specific restriction endonuclease McrA
MAKETFPYQRIYERDKYTCQYCGWSGASDFDLWFIANFNVDHITPVCKGGKDEDSNLVLACRSCNLYKGKIYCSSLEEARVAVKRKRKEAEAWYRKNVLKAWDDGSSESEVKSCAVQV